ncbi:endogenous inhibitor of DNA gyrase (YacG/DUF329 family) [Xanthobacter flavus]|uniref:Endogenous inhibitor of DNA gyrase (YacG/DUF329 family) n=1 Tax=Xanthobacter flavus TaxID=281 RepID=A0A9W6CLA0_XANFL|nr:hypothetical protein [Xanthobacter flavus]MDR6332398.1 endogenous inhibitor of DNA gyrase (YacG/DUF329 family) [Xanthobacter flavus]GLI21852.1 hypothetical protein XFLAVUS301_15260 [Xanthobacter flavus]
MGEIAEMMLDGTLCASCGGYIDDDGADGIPRYCSPQCRRDSGIDEPRTNRAKCPICAKQFPSRKARRQHQKDKHERPAQVQQPFSDRENKP